MSSILNQSDHSPSSRWVNKVEELKLPDISEVMANADGDAVRAAIINAAGAYNAGIGVIKSRIKLITQPSESAYDRNVNEAACQYGCPEAEAAVATAKAILEATGYGNQVKQILNLLESKGQSK